MFRLRLLSPRRGCYLFLTKNPGLTRGATFCRPLCGLVGAAFKRSLFVLIILPSFLSFTFAQTDNSPFPQATDLQHGPPLTRQEYVSLLYQLPAHPAQKDILVDEIRKRGIAFPVTPGLLSLTATKSGNDSLLRHTLEEAERRRANPVAASLPPTTEGLELLERTRKATLSAAEKMPDFLVKQQVSRARAYGQSKNWSVYDRLSIAVSYRQSGNEEYKLLSINGMPATADQTYDLKLGGTTSSGEYVSALAELFGPQQRAEFEMVDTDTLHGRRTIVYEFSVKKEFSRNILIFQDGKEAAPISTIAGHHGRIWVDREKDRVLRIEDISAEIDPSFPITAASTTIDYDWVTINEQQHLLPSRAVVELTSRMRGETEQTRNEILFRGYRKFGAEVKIIDIDEKDFPPDKPEEEPAKPEGPPVLKPAPPKKKP
jgi:hypothetical protein